MAIVSLSEYGFNDGEDCTALMQAIAADTSIIGVYDHSGSTYNYTSTIIFNRDFSFFGNFTLHGIGAYIDCIGLLDEIGYISADEGDMSATFSSVAGLEEGDLLILEKDVNYSLTPYRETYHDGEYARIVDITGSVVTFETNLKTSYTGVSTDKVFKMTPQRLYVEGASFTSSNGVFALRNKYAEGSWIQPRKVEAIGSSSIVALSLSRVYNCDVKGGRYNKPYGSGTDYGIGIGASEDVRICGVNSFGGRHAISTGSDTLDAAVPNRNITIKQSTLANDPNSGTYCADFHGNTIDSYYEDCQIYGSVGLGGRNVGVRGGKVVSGPTLAPFLYHEFIGGRLFCDDIELNCKTTSPYVISNSGGELVSNITEPYQVRAKNIKINSGPNTTTILNALEASGMPSDWEIDGFDMDGDISSWTTCIACAISGAGAVATSIILRNPKKLIPNTVSLMTKSGSAYSGCRVTMPKFTKNQELQILVGKYQSTVGGIGGVLVHAFPTFPAIPTQQLSHSGGSILGGSWGFLIAPSPATTTQAYARVVTGSSVHPSGVDKTYRVTSTVTMEEYVLP